MEDILWDSKLHKYYCSTYYTPTMQAIFVVQTLEEFLRGEMNDRSIVDASIAELEKKYGSTVILAFETGPSSYEWRVLPISVLVNPLVKRVMVVRSGSKIMDQADNPTGFDADKQYLIGKFPLIGIKYADILDRITSDNFTRICSDIQDYLDIGCLDRCSKEIVGRLAEERDSVQARLRQHLDSAIPTDVVIGGEDPKAYDGEEEEGEDVQAKPKVEMKDITAFIKACVNHGTKLCDPLPKQNAERIAKLKEFIDNKALGSGLRAMFLQIGLNSPETISLVQWLKEESMLLGGTADSLVSLMQALYNEEIREVDMLLRNKANITGKIDHKSIYVLPYSLIPNYSFRYGRTMDNFEKLLNDYVGGYLEKLDLSKCYITGSAIACCLYARKKYKGHLSGPISYCPDHSSMLEYYPPCHGRPRWSSFNPCDITTDGKTFDVQTVPPISCNLREGSDVDICVEVETEIEFKAEVDKIFKVVSEARPGVILSEHEKKSGKFYSITDPDPVGALTFRKVEIYRASFAHILTHHVSMVRAGYTSKPTGKPELWMAASCLLTAHDLENHHYWVFASKKTTPVGVLAKYSARGFRFSGISKLSNMLPHGDWLNEKDDACSTLYHTPQEYYVNGYLCPMLINFGCFSCRPNKRKLENVELVELNFGLYRQPIQLSRIPKKTQQDGLDEMQAMMTALKDIDPTHKFHRAELLGKIHAQLLKSYLREGTGSVVTSGTVEERRLFDAAHTRPRKRGNAPRRGIAHPVFIPQTTVPVVTQFVPAATNIMDAIADEDNMESNRPISPFAYDEEEGRGKEEDDEKEVDLSGKGGKEEEDEEEDEEFMG